MSWIFHYLSEAINYNVFESFCFHNSFYDFLSSSSLINSSLMFESFLRYLFNFDVSIGSLGGLTGSLCLDQVASGCFY